MGAAGKECGATDEGVPMKGERLPDGGKGTRRGASRDCEYCGHSIGPIRNLDHGMARVMIGDCLGCTVCTAQWEREAAQYAPKV
jgi:hypothetical protein